MSKENEQALDLSMFAYGEEIIDAGEAEIDWVKLLVYGPSGAGKTSLLATMPDPLIVLLTEKHGAMTIKRVNPKAKIIFIEDKVLCACHDVPIKKCPDGGKRTRVIKAQDVLYGTLDDLRTKEHPFRSVALDSLTDMQQILLSDMKGGQPGADVSLKQWGKLIDKTKHLIKSFRDLNMHVGVICLSDEVQDNTNRLVYRPALAGKKLPGNIIQYFNLCCFQRKTRDAEAVGGAVYESVFDWGPEYYTKTSPALNPVEPPVIRNIVDKIAKYAEEHGEGDMPTESSPVSNAEPSKDTAKADEIEARLNNPRIRRLFDAVGAEPAARRQAAMKYRDDRKLEERILKKIKEKAAKGDKACEDMLQTVAAEAEGGA